ncbi:unnamed protein product [Closterium sp. Naga37s-1]|nr:unnamed protein product [Closterium sp. Naga37s-1]
MYITHVFTPSPPISPFLPFPFSAVAPLPHILHPPRVSPTTSSPPLSPPSRPPPPHPAAMLAPAALLPTAALLAPAATVALAVPPLLTQTHVIPPTHAHTAAAAAAAAAAAGGDGSGGFSGASAAAAAAPPAYGGRTIRVLMVTSAANVADISNFRMNEGLHHNYAVEKWLIELYASNAAAIEGWTVVFRNDNEEALGVRGDTAEITLATADAAAAADAGAGDGDGDGAGAGAGAGAGDNSEWGSSVFCLIPPGRAQWTFQLAKAILSGCIPVTFLRANDNPWAASLYHHSASPSAPSALNYPVFSLNIDPADLNSLPRRLQEAFDQPGLVERLQHNLGLVQVGVGQVGVGQVGVGQVGVGQVGVGQVGVGQDMFKWHDSLDQGAGAVLLYVFSPQHLLPNPHSPAHATGHDMFKWHDSLDRGAEAAGAVLISRLRKIGTVLAQPQLTTPHSLLPSLPSCSRHRTCSSGMIPWTRAQGRSCCMYSHRNICSPLPTHLLTPQDMFNWHDSLDRGAGAVLMSRLRRIGAAAAQSQQLDEQIVLPLETTKKES